MHDFSMFFIVELLGHCLLVPVQYMSELFSRTAKGWKISAASNGGNYHPWLVTEDEILVLMFRMGVGI